jgi:branched-chain amino acid transport system ATP-binding protein
MLSISSLEVHYGAIAAVRGVDIRADGGEIVAIVGANGAGKSTLLKAVAGFVSPTGGRIELDGQELSRRMSVQKRVRQGICLVPEGRQIWSALTVEEHLRLGWFASRPRDRKGYPPALESIYEVFPVLGERRSQFGGTLSGGEQQMLAIGRALIVQPRVLLLDEPSLGLAPIMIERVAEALANARSPERIVVISEQNADFVLGLADRGYVLEVGSPRMEGSAQELLSHPELVDSYLGAAIAI